MIRIIRHRDLLNLDDSDVWYEAPGRTISEMIPGTVDREHCQVRVNEELVPPERWAERPAANSIVTIVDLPGGTAITLGVIALLATGASIALSYLNKPRLAVPGAAANEVDATPKFIGQQTTVGPGQVIPLIYGEVRAGGHIIESYPAPVFDEEDTITGVTVVGSAAETNEEATATNTRVAWCHGPVNSISDIEIEDNPIASVTNVHYQTNTGTNTQGKLFGFDEQTTETSVDQLVEFATSRSQSSSTRITRFQVLLEWRSGLYDINNSTGNYDERTVSVSVNYRIKGFTGSYTTYKTFNVTGARRSLKQVWVDGPVLPEGQYEIEVERNTADNADPDISDEFHFDKVVWIAGGDARTHPGIAESGFRQIPTSQMPAPQKYTAKIQGFSNIRVYTDTSTYTEIYSNKPGWCFLHFLTSKLHGLGAFFDYDDVDIQSFIDLDTYCTAQGFTFNFEFRQRLEFPRIREIFERACNARFVEEGGTWRAIPLENSSAVMHFSAGNYIRDSLRWRRDSTIERPTRLTGVFKNSAQDWNEDRRTIEDSSVTAGGDFVDDEVTLWGVTGSAQAKKLLARQIKWNTTSDESIEFETGVRGLGLRAGDIFSIDSRTGGHGVAGGRLRAVSGTGSVDLELDNEADLVVGTSYEVTVLHVGAGLAHTVETQALATITTTETTRHITITGPWTTEPAAGTVYSLNTVTEGTRLFRCTSVRVGDDLTVRIAGTKHTTDIDTVTVPDDDEVTETKDRMPNPRLIPDAVDDLEAAGRWAFVYNDSTYETILPIIDVSWSGPDATAGSFIVYSFSVWWKPSGTSAWRLAGSTTGSNFEIQMGTRELEPTDVVNVAVVPVSAWNRSDDPSGASTVNVTMPSY